LPGLSAFSYISALNSVFVLIFSSALSLKLNSVQGEKTLGQLARIKSFGLGLPAALDASSHLRSYVFEFSNILILIDCSS